MAKPKKNPTRRNLKLKAKAATAGAKAQRPGPGRNAGGTLVYGRDPLVIHDHYEIDYIHSYAEDSQFFVGLSKGRLQGSECAACHYRFATPRAYCLQCGTRTRWIDLPLQGRIHTWTTCYYGGEAFLNQTPFSLVLVEFEGIDTLFMSRLVGPKQAKYRIGQKVRAKFLRKAKLKATDVYFVPA
jgi:uncharacterized OB-fold protein